MAPTHGSTPTSSGWPRARSLTVILALSLLGAACGTTGSDSGSAADTYEEDRPAVEAESAAGAPVTTMGTAVDGEMGGDRAAVRPLDDEGATEPEAVEDGREQGNTFADHGVRPFVETAVDPLSTFALDVDTGSFTVARGWLDQGMVPPSESVRVEEYVNSFHYDYPVPDDGLALSAEAGPSPFDPDRVLVRVGVQAEMVAAEDRPPASLTFVVDTSGSMDRTDRLELVKTSLSRLVTELDGDDSVAVVTYSDAAEVVLPPTSVDEERTILDAIDSLAPTGSTNLEAGLRRGYDLAADAFVEGGINRVVLASDGVANVGLTDPAGLVQVIRDDADRGVQLVTVGVGMGNYDDATMERLADDGDGFYAYVDTEAEAERLFADDGSSSTGLTSSLLTVALDSKIQVELDPGTVASYRLVGFENRAILDQDFRNDDVDAGELGAGHQVTALYELVLHDGVDADSRLGAVQLRWTDPGDDRARETSLALDGDLLQPSWASTSEDFRLAVTAGAFAELLRHSPHTGDLTLGELLVEAEELTPGSGSLEELRTMIDQARALDA